MSKKIEGLLMRSVSLGYFDLPKCASTSIKNALHLEEFGLPFESRKCSADQGGLQHIHDFFHRTFHANLSEAEHRIIVIRDPVERFLSAYASRVTGHLELSDVKVEQRRRDELVDQNFSFNEPGFIFNPGVGQFLENLERYLEEIPIEWHLRPLAEHLPQGLDQFTQVHIIKRLDLLEAHLSEVYGKDIRLPRLQTMGQHLSVKQLSSSQLEQIIDFCKLDYELLKPWFNPDQVWNRWKSGQYAWVYQSAARRFEETLRLSRTPADLLISNLEGKKISYVSSSNELERSMPARLLDRALLKGSAQVRYIALASRNDRGATDYQIVDSCRWKVLFANSKNFLPQFWKHISSLNAEFARNEPDLVHCYGLLNAMIVKTALLRLRSKTVVVVELSSPVANRRLSLHSALQRLRLLFSKLMCLSPRTLPLFHLDNEQDQSFFWKYQAKLRASAYCVPVIDENMIHLASIDSSHHGVLLLNASSLRLDEISLATALITELICNLNKSEAWSNLKILMPRQLAAKEALLKTGLEPHLNSPRICIINNTSSILSEIQSSQVVIIPSLRSKSARQFTLETQQVGRPVIAPNDSHGRMLVKNGLSGFLFSDKRLDLAAKNVERLISTRGLPEKMGFKGRLHVETHFTSERAFEVMIEQYHSLL